MVSISSVGRPGFVERFGLGSAERERRVAEIVTQSQSDGIEIVRLSFVDQHGLLRGKTVPIDTLPAVLRDGCAMTTTLLLKDTSHRTIFPVWQAAQVLGTPELSGAGDFVMVPDPATFKRLPWTPKTGWLLCDIYLPSGAPLVMCTRNLLRQSVAALAEQGFQCQMGLEMEFHVFKLEDAHLNPAASGQPAQAPDISLTTHGYQYLTEDRADQSEAVTECIRHAVQGLGLPLRSIEVELGPSQYEFTFHPTDPLAQADAAVLFRSAVKQACRREGFHATFMCRPALANIFSSGWHLHQSLSHIHDGANAFTPTDPADLLSPTGRHYVAGLLTHAAASMLLTTPTVNGYKRYRPFSMAPDRLVWSGDNKGALVRAVGGVNDGATRIENRIGEPSANPYLYAASQLRSGMAGITAAQEPPAPTDTPYQAEAPALPSNLWEAVKAFKQSPLYRRVFGERFVDYLAAIKEAEFNRFMESVTDWEQREYFSNF